jgi:NAD+ diphosphatase
VPLPSFDSFRPAEEGEVRPEAQGYWFILRGSDLLLLRNGDSIQLPLLAGPDELCPNAGRAHVIGIVDGIPCRVADVPLQTQAPRGASFEGVRTLFGTISDGFFAAAARALEIADWDRSHRFCGACGSPTRLKLGERAFECTACGQLAYPRISPAAIAAVVRGDRILLARAGRFPPGMFSVLAGFVEPGETLEECVVREVREETGVEVKNLRYFASQPWPFPHSLMVAFTSEYASGEIRIDPREIADARWFTAETLPRLPDPVSVARRLIDWFVAGCPSTVARPSAEGP